MYVLLDPVPLKTRASFVFLSYGQIDVVDNAFVLIDKNGVRTHIPVGSVACVFLEPGTRITHAAVNLAATAGTLLLWVGEAGVRLYAAGNVGCARFDHLLWQAKLLLTPEARLRVVQKMFELRFGEVPAHRSVSQLRGMEGKRVRDIYTALAQTYHVPWQGRNYDVSAWHRGDPINRALSCATSCLYGITEAAILVAGYSPALGFLHSGKPRSFVYDIADLVKFDTVVPLAFEMTGNNPRVSEGEIRRACRDLFQRQRLLGRIIPMIEEVLQAGNESLPQEPDYIQPIAIDETDPFAGDHYQR